MTLAPRSPRLTSSSTPRLSEVARHLILPAGIVSTGWPSVARLLAALGVEFDPWQVGAGSAILAKRADGQYAADTSVLSIPRQVGKTFLVGAIVFALCIIRPGLLVIWTAHHTRTSDETFADLRTFAANPRAAKHVKAVRSANGQQGLIFHNGSRILFGAREQGFGRGFKKVGILVLDEAQILTESAMDNLVPTTNQADNPLILMAGTPPRPRDPGEVFTNLRTEAITAGSGNGDTFYLELSADEDADLNDRVQWAKANPSFPKRTKVRAILRMLKHLGAASFRREALGIWDLQTQEQAVIALDEFMSRAADPPPDGPVAYGVRYSADGSRVSLSVAVATETGAFVEVVDSAFSSVGIAVTRDWLVDRWRTCDAIVLDGKAGAGALQEALLDAGVNHRRIIRPTPDMVITASSNFVEMVRDGSLSHAGQPGLIACVKDAKRRPIGVAGGWGFASMSGELDQSPLESAALAVHGLGGVRRRDGKKRVAGGGRMVGA